MRRRRCLLLLLLLHLIGSVIAERGEVGCDFPEPSGLRADRITVLISGFSERRLPLLRSIATSYAAHPAVAAILVLWGNPSTPADLLSSLAYDGGGAPISVHHHPTASLNARFLPRTAIRTRAIAICDDDVLADPAALSFALSVWQRGHPSALVGFFGRGHDLDLARRAWVYTAPVGARQSIVLTKLVVTGTSVLRRYSCSPELAAARSHVERVRNCEDILLNFVSAMETGAGPVVVDAGSVRDWGDPRNQPWPPNAINSTDDDMSTSSEEQREETEVAKAGLSSRGVEHLRARGECISEFHRLLRRMPLRFSHGKVVESARFSDPGLCRKAGKIVPCDLG